MASKPMGEQGLRDLHDAINSVVSHRITDKELTETAMTKTEDGYVYEIRYKKPGWPWRAELPVDPKFIEQMESEEGHGDRITSPL